MSLKHVAYSPKILSLFFGSLNFGSPFYSSLFLSLLTLALGVYAEAQINPYMMGLKSPRNLASQPIALPLETKRTTCSRMEKGEPIVTQGDFHWGMSFEEMKALAEKMYFSPKRLIRRAYYDASEEKFVLDYKSTKGVTKVLLEERFIHSVALHIEKSLKMGYADFVFFPDMGHSHLHIPQEVYDREIKPLTKEVSKRNLLYQAMLGHPATTFLYHTAEQLQMHDKNREPLKDRFSMWRLMTRNPVGDNMATGRVELSKELDDGHNTSRDVEGTRRWSGGFNIHANVNGCFPYRAKDGSLKYFDMSLEDLPIDDSASMQD